MADFLGRCLRWAVALSLCAALLYAANLSGRQVFAAMYAAYADAQAQADDSSYAALRVAVRFDDDNPDYWRRLAASAGKRNELELEDTAYVRAITARPAWPYGWSATTRSLAERGHYGPRLTLALRQSQALGPNERMLQYSNAVTAMAFWYYLSLEQRKLLDPSIDFVLARKRYARLLASAIDALDREHLFCEHFRDRVDYGPIWCYHWGIETSALDRDNTGVSIPGRRYAGPDGVYLAESGLLRPPVGRTNLRFGRLFCKVPEGFINLSRQYRESLGGVGINSDLQQQKLYLSCEQVPSYAGRF